MASHGHFLNNVVVVVGRLTSKDTFEEGGIELTKGKGMLQQLFFNIYILLFSIVRGIMRGEDTFCRDKTRIDQVVRESKAFYDI